MGFLEALREQRWDDHRYYHHSRINQTLHLVSALSFLTAYVLVFFDPAVAALIGWLVAMTTRQAGHFFFEPKGYDHTNHATHEHKEDIKVGYNLQRKIVLLTIWALSPLVLLARPDPVRHFRAGDRRRRLHPADRENLAGARPRRPDRPHHPAVLHPRRADRPGLGDQDPHRPVPRHQALLQGAALSPARRVDRPEPRQASADEDDDEEEEVALRPL